MPSSGDGMVAEDWWHAFGSAELDALVERAAAGSDDIAAAVARVHQATAQARIAGAASWPEVNATVSAGRQTGGAGDITDDNGNSFAAGLLASYEVDFWGRNRALRHAAAAQFQASAHDRDTVRLTVVATAASLWMQTVALRERADIAAQNLALARQTLALVESRARSGADFPLDVAQQRSLVATQQRTVAALAQAAHDSEAALAAVLGTTPERLDLGSRSLDPLAMPAIDAGVPSSLLARRPDIARAEALLAAADANVAAARAAMLPSLTLDAGVGFASDTAHSLFDTPLYSVAAGLAAPIFNAGRLRAGRDLAVAQREELLAGYHAAIVAAFGDVDRALNALAGLAAQASAQGEALVQASRAYALAQSGYRAGAETLVTVLSAQQALFAARDEAIQLKQARLQAAVALYRALGGGWRGEAPTLSWASPWRHG
jgi:NodT family efflux transporter outer membrane factor (OMF) lipoprotein